MNESAILYEEVQGYNSESGKKLLKIFNAIVLGVCLLLIFWNRAAYRDIILTLLVLAILISLIGVLFIRTRLITQFRTEGIYVRYAPFHTRFKVFKWENISELYLREYHPMREYGGWGIRMGPAGEAFTISGNKGLQLILKNGKKILIGTNDLEGMERVMEYINRHLVHK